TSSGEAFGFKFQRLEWHGGYHAFTIQYGTGAASNFSSNGSGTVVENPTPFINSQAQFLITEQVLIQPNDKFAIMPIFVYQRTKDGNPLHPWQQWVSFGARPEISLPSASLWRLKADLITPTAQLLRSTTAGCASLRSPHKSVRDGSSLAGRCCGHS
ncbi:MAG: carbohydrate porin, partial [Acidobacteriaceae bacterium]|nr:carbohydrate porin [Acidobacteriaceae bacterium]